MHIGRVGSTAALGLCSLAAFGGIRAPGGAGEPASASSGDPVTVGLIMEETGPLELLGKPSAVAGRAAVEAVNAEGGVGGQPVEVAVCDTQSLPERAVTCYEELTRGGANIIVGPINTASGLAVLPLTARDGVFYYPLSGSLLQSDVEANPNTFLGNVSSPDLMSAVFAWMRSEGLSEASMMAQSGVISDPCRDMLEDDEYADAREGIEIRSVVEFDRDAQSVVPQLAQVEGGDVLMLCSAGTGTLVSVAGWDETGLAEDMLVMVPNSSQSDEFAIAVSDRVQAVDGVRVAAYCTLLIRATPEQLGDSPPACYEEAMRYADAVEALDPGTPVDGLSATTWDAVRQALAAVDAVGSTDAAAMTEYLEGQSDLPGAAGSYTFGEDAHRGLGPESVVIGNIVDGLWAPLWFDGLRD